MNEKISVIVPVYRSEKTLDRCVQSLLKQTYENTEIILVDDGSPDPSADMCDAYSKNEEKVRSVHRTNKGVSSARNEGIDLAEGTFVAFVDSDDYVEPDYLEKLHKTLTESGSDIAIAGFHHIYVGQDIVKCPSAGDDLVALYEKGFLNMPWNKLFYREKLGRFPLDLSLGEDLLLNLDYLKRAGKFAVCDVPLIHYIQDGKTKTLSNQKRADKLDIAKRIRNAAAETLNEKYPSEEARIRRATDTRFLCEVLDDIEALPFDKEMKKAEKMAFIEQMIGDETVCEACRYAEPAAADYRMIAKALAEKNAKKVYDLTVLRSVAVKAKRALGK